MGKILLILLAVLVAVTLTLGMVAIKHSDETIERVDKEIHYVLH